MGHSFSRQSSCQDASARYIPDIQGRGLVFQQDGALEHRARDTVAFLELKVPDFIPPTLWPPNTPELNPVDYSIWSSASQPFFDHGTLTWNRSPYGTPHLWHLFKTTCSFGT